MEKLYNANELGEKIKDFIVNKGLTEEKLSKEITEYGGSLSARQIRKYEDDNSEPDMKATNLLALSQIMKMSIDSLLGNTVKITNYQLIITSEIGIKKDGIDKLKKYKNRNKRLLKPKRRSIDDITEIDVLNYIISETNLLSIIKEETKNYITEQMRVKRILNMLDINKSKEQKKSISDELREKEDNLKANISKELNRIFKNFVVRQTQLLNKK